MVNDLYPKSVNGCHNPHGISMGACIDDRNFRGPLHALKQAYVHIAQFDKGAGHTLQADKTSFHTTCQEDTKDIKTTALGGVIPRVNQPEVLIGEPINVHMRHTHQHANAKLYNTISTANIINTLATARHRKKRLHSTVTIPQMIYPTLWSMPKGNTLTHLRTKILRGIWGDASKLRAVEVVLAILNDPTKLDPTIAIIANALNTARRVTRKNPERMARLSEDIKAIAKAYDQQEGDKLPKLPQGPAYGTFKAARIINIDIQVKKGIVTLNFPTGAKIPLDTPHVTYFNASIREAARYTILEHLSDRVNQDGADQWLLAPTEEGHMLFEEERDTTGAKNTRGDNAQAPGFRKDMVGIYPYVDIQATRSNLDKKNTRHNYKTHPDRARMLETIIAGSIRAPDRLYKAGIVDNECCDHPDCKGDRATTKHIMWHCHHYDHVRSS